ncbi:MAG: hypothetical protein P4L87_09060, partial [Formivibrio sp.]|nr:hypothetical protein [Formivibrio sp.]
TTLASGAKAADGYQALGELDSNHDGVINANDAAFADLSVWVDANSDGVSEAGEVKSLSSLGITQISLQTTATSTVDNGNIVGLTSSYETADGATHAAADVWFVADKPAEAVVPSVAAPSTQTQVVNAAGDLRTLVSTLTQTIGAFAGSQDASGGSTSPQLAPAVSNPSSAAPSTLASVNMAEVMKQFDANGQTITNLAGAAVPSTTSLTLPGSQSALSSGFLVGGGKA